MLGKLYTIRNEQWCLFNTSEIKTNLHYKVAEKSVFELRRPVVEFCAGKHAVSCKNYMEHIWTNPAKVSLL
jgi:hypothetical protein